MAAEKKKHFWEWSNEEEVSNVQENKKTVIGSKDIDFGNGQNKEDEKSTQNEDESPKTRWGKKSKPKADSGGNEHKNETGDKPSDHDAGGRESTGESPSDNQKAESTNDANDESKMPSGTRWGKKEPKQTKAEQDGDVKTQYNEQHTSTVDDGYNSNKSNVGNEATNQARENDQDKSIDSSYPNDEKKVDQNKESEDTGWWGRKKSQDGETKGTEQTTNNDQTTDNKKPNEYAQKSSESGKNSGTISKEGENRPNSTPNKDLEDNQDSREPNTYDNKSNPNAFQNNEKKKSNTMPDDANQNTSKSDKENVSSTKDEANEKMKSKEAANGNKPNNEEKDSNGLTSTDKSTDKEQTNRSGQQSNIADEKKVNSNNNDQTMGEGKDKQNSIQDENSEWEDPENINEHRLILYLGIFNIVITILFLFLTEFVFDCTVLFNKKAVCLLVIAVVPFFCLSIGKKYVGIALSVISSLLVLFLLIYLFEYRVRVYIYKFDIDGFIPPGELKTLVSEATPFSTRQDVINQKTNNIIFKTLTESQFRGVKIILFHSKYRTVNGNERLMKEKADDLIHSVIKENADDSLVFVHPILGLNWVEGQEELLLRLIRKSRFSNIKQEYVESYGFFDLNETNIKLIRRRIYDFYEAEHISRDFR